MPRCYAAKSGRQWPRPLARRRAEGRLSASHLRGVSTLQRFGTSSSAGNVRLRHREQACWPGSSCHPCPLLLTPNTKMPLCRLSLQGNCWHAAKQVLVHSEAGILQCRHSPGCPPAPCCAGASRAVRSPVQRSSLLRVMPPAVAARAGDMAPLFPLSACRQENWALQHARRCVGPGPSTARASIPLLPLGTLCSLIIIRAQVPPAPDI